MVTNGPNGGVDDELTIERRDANAGLGIQLVYRTNEGEILTFEEAFDALTPEMAEGLEGLPPEEQVMDGTDALEFILESGIYQSVDVEGQIVTHYSDGQTRWTEDHLRSQVFPNSAHGNLKFGDWLAAQVESGALKAVDVLQFVAEDENANVGRGTVIAERLIVD